MPPRDAASRCRLAARHHTSHAQRKALTRAPMTLPRQENAELLTEEGRLLQGIQGDDVVDYDIDAYAQRLQVEWVNAPWLGKGTALRVQRIWDMGGHWWATLWMTSLPDCPLPWQEILDRKATLISVLQAKLSGFRRQLSEEEEASRHCGPMPQY